ncbi:hypothetical protein RIF29_41702 [Crotalaria pallida]|uniref:Uncharacterized protein n=1 Tax=Crotalaria pallida TaxID=3830 RepID=A0AAN9EBN0_CROPI
MAFLTHAHVFYSLTSLSSRFAKKHVEHFPVPSPHVLSADQNSDTEVHVQHVKTESRKNFLICTSVSLKLLLIRRQEHHSGAPTEERNWIFVQNCWCKKLEHG